MKISLVQTCCLMVVYLPVALSMTLNSKTDPSSTGDLLADSDVDVYKKYFPNKVFTGSAKTENIIMKILKIMAENKKTEDSKNDDGQKRDSHMKRLKPSFNPTGWRRKRDTTWDAVLAEALRDESGRFRHPLPEEKDSSKEQWRKRTMSNGSSRRYSSSGSYASSRKRFIDRSSKRKPLQFNPTGW